MMNQPDTDYGDLKASIRERAIALGFQVVGFTTADPFPEVERVIHQRVAAGMFSGLPWFTAERASFCCDPHNHMPDARTLISLAISYNAPAFAPFENAQQLEDAQQPRGVVARYAWGLDYHKVLGERLRQLSAQIRDLCPMEIRSKTFVDTGRIVDRAVAQRAGVGWFGKNANVLTRRFGSWVFLAEILTNLPLPPDPPLKVNCGKCTACVPSCPTKAIVAPGVVDNDRCISYLTIEHRGPIPLEFRSAIGNRIFGCDDCQDVCPVNRRAQIAAPPEFHPEAGIGGAPALVPLLRLLLALDESTFKEKFRHTALARPGRGGLIRNVCVALGNSHDRRVVDVLGAAIDDHDSIVRMHAAWALGQIGGDDARRLLDQRLLNETDKSVRRELVAATASVRASAAPSSEERQQSA